MKSLLVGFKNVLLWSYERGTWQYDILCALIVLTLLVWPSAKTQRQATAQTVAPVVSTSGAFETEIEWQELRALLQQQNKLDLLDSPREAVTLYLQIKAQTAVSLTKLEPFGDAQGRRGYRVQYRTD